MSEARHILVTGSGKGLGKALAEHFLQQGDVVFGCARSSRSLDHKNYLHFSLDVTDETAVKQLFKEIRQQYKHLDGLINNAGIAKMNAFALTPIESARQVMDVNFNGTFLFCQAAIGMLRKSKNPRIVNMSTVAVPLRLDGEAAYAASKSAVEMLTRIVAKELGGFKITCNALGPSPIHTDLIKGVGEDKIQQLVKRQAVPRMARVEDVINAVEFFLRRESGMITGQVLYLGGIS